MIEVGQPGWVHVGGEVVLGGGRPPAEVWG